MNAFSDPADTIAALSSAPGRGAVAVVRISGPLALESLRRFCFTKGLDFAERPRVMHRVDVRDGEVVIDDGMAVFFPGPNSYTGEDSAEFYFHGSPLLVRRFLQLLAERLHIRPALPGEFTRRAFQNGKMDLTTAESIRRIIDARSEYELEGARRLYSGDLKRSIARFRSALLNLKAETEAEVDFSDEDLTFESIEARRLRVEDLLVRINDILSRSGAAQRVSDGFKIALVGITNAGKSSLLNRLLGWDRSIVSDIHGTTRDYVSEDVELGEFRVRFVDTAGLRSTEDTIEKEGIRRSVEEMRRSQLILHLIDGSRESLEISAELVQELSEPQEAKKVFHILNKIDALHGNTGSADYFAAIQGDVPIRISCKTGEGIDELRSRIVGHLEEQPGGLDPYLLEERHRFHFAAMRDALNRLLSLWDDHAPDEICALEIDEALRNAAAITGEISSEEILGRIFSIFCVGK